MSEFGLKIRSRDIETLLTYIKTHWPEDNINLIKEAYAYAEEKHKQQKRLSGEPFIIHPLEVALILAELQMDSATIAAALLHDVVEDTITPLKSLQDKFGKEIAQLVDGVTKISSIKKRTKHHDQAHTLRKMLLATINDARVIIIKLADKTHNMRTLMFQPEHKQKKIANEVLDIYAPLAGRLGMSKIRSELEDLAFHVLHPDEYSKIKEHVAAHKEELESYIQNFRTFLQKKLHDMNIEATISGRIKHYYSIYRKMITQHKTFDQIFDIRAIRIITHHVKDCYGILGVIHTLFSPVPSRFKDYIAVPKSNMYQSLHTTVIGPEKHFLEIQIRTQKMHLTAEMGIAAHWAYKEKKQEKPNIHQDLALLQDISKWRAELKDTKEFMTELKMELYVDEIFVFTPKGKIIKLAKGATPIDFAYAIHTEVGNHCIGAKVNNKIVPLKTKIKSGDIIEIITSPKGHPSETWLKIVKSSNARSKIRNWLRKRNKNRTEVESIKEQVKNKKDTPKTETTAEVSIPENELIKIRQYNKENKTNIIVEGNENVLIKLAQCCQPIPGDNVIGFITRGRGISVHKKNCPSLQRLYNEKERFISIVWADSENMYPVKIALHATDRPHLLKDIAEEFALMKTNIIKMEAQTETNGKAVLKFIIEVRSVEHMNEVLSKLNNIKNVFKAHKINEKVVLK